MSAPIFLTPAEVELVGYAEAALQQAQGKRDRSLRLIADAHGIAGAFRIVPVDGGLVIAAVQQDAA